MHKNIEKILRGLLIFGGCYFVFDGLLHLSGFKLLSVESWPAAAKAYANLINVIYASFVFLASIFVFIMQKNLKKYKSLIVLSAIWAPCHGLILIFLVWTNNYQQIFQAFPSLLVWLPIYREYITINALLLVIYSITVYIWKKKSKY